MTCSRLSARGVLLALRGWAAREIEVAIAFIVPPRLLVTGI